MSLQLCPGCKKWQETPYLHSQPSNFCENCRKRQRPNEVDGFKQSSVVSDDPLGAFSKKYVIKEALAPNPNQQMMTYSCDDCNEPVKDTLFMNMFDSSQRCMACAQKDGSGMLHVPIPVPMQTMAPKKPSKKSSMTRCLFCGSQYDEWEAEDGFCPDCGSDQSKEPRYVQADPETGEPIAAQHPSHPQDMSVGEDPGHDYQKKGYTAAVDKHPQDMSKEPTDESRDRAQFTVKDQEDVLDQDFRCARCDNPNRIRVVYYRNMAEGSYYCANCGKYVDDDDIHLGGGSALGPS